MLNYLWVIKHKGDGPFSILILLNWQIFMCKKRDLSLRGGIWGKHVVTNSDIYTT